VRYSIDKNRGEKEGRTMIKYSGGHKVRKGTYWNFTTGERVDVSHEEVLPGNSRTTYFRLPASGILILGPILGLIYAAFLPFIEAGCAEGSRRGICACQECCILWLEADRGISRRKEKGRERVRRR
jgi:hypothetical protein